MATNPCTTIDKATMYLGAKREMPPNDTSNNTIDTFDNHVYTRSGVHVPNNIPIIGTLL
jgi:hypothetical protein